MRETACDNGEEHSDWNAGQQTQKKRRTKHDLRRDKNRVRRFLGTRIDINFSNLEEPDNKRDV